MKLRHWPFLLLAVVVAALITATFVEKYWGSGVAVDRIYTAPWFIALWTAVAAVSVAVLFRARLYRRPAAMLLHLSFIVILAGALVTHLWGRQGTVHLRTGQPQTVFLGSADSLPASFPFALELKHFSVENYPGTQSPMDYVSVVQVKQADGTAATLQISMNRIGQYGGYRFYQSGYDDDRQGTMLAVSHDPWGIGISYAGYGLLFVSMLLLLLLPGEGFRRLLRATRRGVAAVLLAVGCTGATAAPQADMPRTLPQDVATQMGRLYIYHNGRICPLQTMARDFTAKLCGKTSYRGLSSEQVVAGWMFYPTEWTRQPIIKVKPGVARRLGISGRYAAYADFHSSAGYKLEQPLADIRAGRQVADARAIIEADEKMNILLMLFNGQLLKIYPYSHQGQTRWLSQSDKLPREMDEAQYMFVKKSMDYVGELVWTKRTDEAAHVLHKIRSYQQREAAGVLPSPTLLRAERLYNKVADTRWLAFALLALGILLYIATLFAPHSPLPALRKSFLTPRSPLLAPRNSLLPALYLLLVIALRGYVSGHLPLASGFETMQFMAFCTLIITALLARRFPLATPLGLLLAGLTLLVAMMGESNPQLTPLMPVLASPLLSLHVCIIMAAYSLLAFTMLNGITALLLHATSPHRSPLPAPRSPKTSPAPPSSPAPTTSPDTLRSPDTPRSPNTTTLFSRLLLYPAVFCLAAGIFIGAIWANQSWGRYWGWDPKEVWALITLLVYALPLHSRSVRWLQRPLWFHLYMVLAFLTILMTYFGVNYFLGGMHSYA